MKHSKLKPGKKKIYKTKTEEIKCKKSALAASKSRIMKTLKQFAVKLEQEQVYDPVDTLFIVRKKNTKIYHCYGYGELKERFLEAKPLTDHPPFDNRVKKQMPEVTKAAQIELLTPSKDQYSFGRGSGQSLAEEQKQYLDNMPVTVTSEELNFEQPEAELLRREKLKKLYAERSEQGGSRGQRGRKGQRGVSRGQRGVSRGQRGVSRGQRDVSRGQRGVSRGQRDVSRGQRGVSRGQRGVQGQRCGIGGGKRKSTTDNEEMQSKVRKGLFTAHRIEDSDSNGSGEISPLVPGCSSHNSSLVRIEDYESNDSGEISPLIPNCSSLDSSLVSDVTSILRDFDFGALEKLDQDHTDVHVQTPTGATFETTDRNHTDVHVQTPTGATFETTDRNPTDVHVQTPTGATFETTDRNHTDVHVQTPTGATFETTDRNPTDVHVQTPTGATFETTDRNHTDVHVQTPTGATFETTDRNHTDVHVQTPTGATFETTDRNHTDVHVQTPTGATFETTDRMTVSSKNGQIEKGDFILVEFKIENSKKSKRYIGEVIQLSSNECFVTFMKRSAKFTYVWPELKDKSTISYDQIVKKLDPPSILHKRRCLEMVFSEDT